VITWSDHLRVITWGHGVIGYVAETGVVVRLDSNASNTVTHSSYYYR